MAEVFLWEAIIPEKLKMREIARELHKALNVTAKLIENDLKEPIDVDFKTVGPTQDQVTVKTDNEKYAYVNYGTKPHRIEPRAALRLSFLANFSPKTTVGALRSGPGGSSPPRVFSKGVDHPGTKERRFDKLTVDDVQPKFTQLVQKALIDGATKAGLR